MSSGWIIANNLKPFCETVATFGGYGFDDSDWDAIATGVKRTDYEQGNWFEYEMQGDSPVTLKIARDPGTSVLFVAVEADAAIQARMTVAIEIMQTYHLHSE